MQILYIIILSLLLVSVIGSISVEEYDSEDLNESDEDNNDISVIDFDSNEIKNTSAKTKPVRIKLGISVKEDNATTTTPNQNQLNYNKIGKTDERSKYKRFKNGKRENEVRGIEKVEKALTPHTEKTEKENELRRTDNTKEGSELRRIDNTKYESALKYTEKTEEGVESGRKHNTTEGVELRRTDNTNDESELRRKEISKGNKLKYVGNIEKQNEIRLINKTAEGSQLRRIQKTADVGQVRRTEKTKKISESKCTEKNADGNECKLSLSNYPYSVTVQRKNYHYASGALIDKRWVLTVAAEFYNVRESVRLFRARMGSVNSKKGGVLIRITLIEIHPLFTPHKPSYDLGLLRLAVPVTFSDYIKPVSLSELDTNIMGTNFITTYWPRLVIRGAVLPSTAKERQKWTSMRVSTQKLIPWETCSRILKQINDVLDDSNMCLNALISHHSACMPDVGAPVAAKDGLWGITSGWIPENCTSSPIPTIITKISSLDVRSWLDKFREMP